LSHFAATGAQNFGLSCQKISHPVNQNLRIAYENSSILEVAWFGRLFNRLKLERSPAGFVGGGQQARYRSNFLFE
jgi:hypothetical protein